MPRFGTLILLINTSECPQSACGAGAVAPSRLVTCQRVPENAVEATVNDRAQFELRRARVNFLHKRAVGFDAIKIGRQSGVIR